MTAWWSKIRIILQDSVLRRKISFVLGALVVFRLAASVPIPGVNTEVLGKIFSGYQFLCLLNLFSCGGLSNLSIVMLGVGPYITASIAMQLLTVAFPALKEIYQNAGEAGRRKLTQYARFLSVPLAVLQGYGLLALLESQNVLFPLSFSDRLENVLVVAAGSVLLMWLGELISQYGIGNGVSLLIFAGILAGIPSVVSQTIATFDPAQVPTYLVLAVVAIAMVALVVIVTEAERPIPVTYAKRMRGMKLYGGTSTYLPIRLNQAGVMPIIFALSLLLFPQLIIRLLSGIDNNIVQSLSDGLLRGLNNEWIYGGLYFILVVIFTYFYSAITFDPQSISENLQKNGAFIPGIRPGRPTTEYLNRIVNRLTLVGALFLGVVAMLPLVIRAITNLGSLAIGGTALLIVVSVALELSKQIDAQIAMRQY